jgi:hypothetical protein
VRARHAATTEAEAIAARLSPPARDEIRRRVRELLAARAELLASAQAEADALQRSLREAEPRVSRELARLDRTPLGPGTTVHAAHARHPRRSRGSGVGRTGRTRPARRGADETLAEAAFGESLPLEALLTELNALLG